jgi:retron-type reverse transcriptase
MKRYTNLWPQVVSFENLYLAFCKAARGKRSQPNVAAFEFDLEGNLVRLREELASSTYRPGPYNSFTIRDPKRRLVSAAPFRDRVVHHALCNVIEPIFERTFIGDSYANRVGRGTHKAVDRCQAFARRYPYVLRADVRQYFPSIDHEVLRRILARKLADGDVMWLVEQILRGGEGVLDDEYEMVWFPQDVPSTSSAGQDPSAGQGLLAACRPRGLPVGNLTSQFWANVYLNELDQYVKRVLRCRAYLRYVDDFCLFADDKAQLWVWKDAVRERLAGLRLMMHERSSTVSPVRDGIPFLGFRIYPTHRLLRRRNGVAFARRFRTYRWMVARGEMSPDQLRRRVLGWVAHVSHGDTYRLRRSLLSSAPPIVRSRARR